MKRVRRLLRQMPADLRQRLDEQRRTLAVRAWDQVRPVWDCRSDCFFIQQFGDLPLGVEAWWWLGCHERDHARHRLAAAAFARMADHPHAGKRQRSHRTDGQFRNAHQLPSDKRSLTP